MSRCPKKLTASFLETLRPAERDLIVFDSLLSGFAIRVTPAGTKLFIVQAWARGRKHRVTVGTSPAMTLADARREARGVLEDLRAGRDPLIERAIRQRAIEAGAMTIAELTDKWLADHVCKLKPRSAFEYNRLLGKRILPALGHLPVTRISRDDVNRLHVAMAKTPREANHTLAILRALLGFACDLKLRPPLDNPCRKIKMFREQARERFLSEREIAAAAEAIATTERSGKIGPHAAAGLRLALFTGARSGEITAALWTHIDWQRNIIRLPDSKTNEPRTIHLSEAAIEVLKTIPRVGPFIVAGANEGEPYKNLSRAWSIARKYSGLDDVRLHDLRHSYASLAAARGISLQMIGKLLGHKTSTTTARYAHLARDAVAAVNDELGAAMVAAIEKGQPAAAQEAIPCLTIPTERAHINSACS